MPRPRNIGGGVITPRMNSYLLALPAHEGRVAKTCQALAIRPNALIKWRNRSTAFKTEEERVRLKIAAERGEAQKLQLHARNVLKTQTTAAGITDELEPWQKVFLLIYQRDKDRIIAARAAEKTWKEVKLALEESKAFREGFDEVEEELDVQLHDAQLRRAIATGDAATSNSLRKAAAEKVGKEKIGPAASRRERVEKLRAEREVN